MKNPIFWVVWHVATIAVAARKVNPLVELSLVGSNFCDKNEINCRILRGNRKYCMVTPSIPIVYINALTGVNVVSSPDRIWVRGHTNEVTIKLSLNFG